MEDVLTRIEKSEDRGESWFLLTTGFTIVVVVLSIVLLILGVKMHMRYLNAQSVLIGDEQ